MIINSYMFGPSYDADAQAVITAIEGTGATLTATQKGACNQLIVDLKGYGLWTKIKALYGFLGGTAGAHKWNWKNPQDTNAAFRLVFSGGWTHSSTGALPNGTNAYANTYISPNTSLSLNSTHISYYSRTNVNTTQIEIGSQSPNAWLIIEARTSNLSYFLVNTNQITGASDTNSAAFYLANRTGSFVTNGFRNNSKIFNSTVASNALTMNNLYIGALNNLNNVAQYYSTKECAFSSIGDGLTDTEAANFYTAVQAYNTTLGRNN